MTYFVVSLATLIFIMLCSFFLNYKANKQLTEIDGLSEVFVTGRENWKETIKAN